MFSIEIKTLVCTSVSKQFVLKIKLILVSVDLYWQPSTTWNKVIGKVKKFKQTKKIQLSLFNLICKKGREQFKYNITLQKFFKKIKLKFKLLINLKFLKLLFSIILNKRIKKN